MNIKIGKRFNVERKNADTLYYSELLGRSGVELLAQQNIPSFKYVEPFKNYSY